MPPSVTDIVSRGESESQTLASITPNRDTSPALSLFMARNVIPLAGCRVCADRRGKRGAPWKKSAVRGGGQAAGSTSSGRSCFLFCLHRWRHTKYRFSYCTTLWLEVYSRIWLLAVLTRIPTVSIGVAGIMLCHFFCCTTCYVTLVDLVFLGRQDGSRTAQANHYDER